MKRLISTEAVQHTNDNFDIRWDKKFNEYYDSNAKTVTMSYSDYAKFAKEVENFE